MYINIYKEGSKEIEGTAKLLHVVYKEYNREFWEVKFRGRNDISCRWISRKQLETVK